MFKLILTVALFTIALKEPVFGEEAITPYTEVTNDLGDGVAVTSGACSSPCGMTKIKLEIEVPSGACGVAAPVEDTCLGVKNSKKISRSTLNVIHKNPDYTFAVLKDLKIIDFMYSCIKYHDFAENIQNNDFGYVGYPRLKKLVSKYTVCQKVCKVYATLRKALRTHAANAEVYTELDEAGNNVVKVNGDLIILNDVLESIKNLFAEDSTLTGVEFIANTFIADANMLGEDWAGKSIAIYAVDFILVDNFMFDVSAGSG